MHMHSLAPVLSATSRYEYCWIIRHLPSCPTRRFLPPLASGGAEREYSVPSTEYPVIQREIRGTPYWVLSTALFPTGSQAISPLRRRRRRGGGRLGDLLGARPGGRGLGHHAQQPPVLGLG